MGIWLNGYRIEFRWVVEFILSQIEINTNTISIVLILFIFSTQSRCQQVAHSAALLWGNLLAVTPATQLIVDNDRTTTWIMNQRTMTKIINYNYQI